MFVFIMAMLTSVTEIYNRPVQALSDFKSDFLLAESGCKLQVVCKALVLAKV